MPGSYVEVGCLGTWGLEPLTPNPGRKNTPKACPTSNPATSPFQHISAPGQTPNTVNQEFSGEIRTVMII